MSISSNHDITLTPERTPLLSEPHSPPQSYTSTPFPRNRARTKSSLSQLLQDPTSGPITPIHSEQHAAEAPYHGAFSTSSSIRDIPSLALWNPTSNSKADSSPEHVYAVSLTLENSGSVARDHLASERTFLAYVRTSLAIASAGVALAQLLVVSTSIMNENPSTGHRIKNFARPLGAAAIILGLLVLIMGISRYFTIQTALTKGFFPVARAGVVAISAALTVLIAVTFWVLLAAR